MPSFVKMFNFGIRWLNTGMTQGMRQAGMAATAVLAAVPPLFQSLA